MFDFEHDAPVRLVTTGDRHGYHAVESWLSNRGIQVRRDSLIGDRGSKLSRRIDAGKQRLKPFPADPERFTAQVVNTFASRSKNTTWLSLLRENSHREAAG